MPFYIGIPQVANGQLHLNWDSSYNFTVEDIYYTVELAKDYLFNKVLYRQENLILPELTMDMLPAGQYFCGFAQRMHPVTRRMRLIIMLPRSVSIMA